MTSVVLVTLAEMKRVLEFSFVLKTGIVERIEKSIIWYRQTDRQFFLAYIVLNIVLYMILFQWVCSFCTGKN